MKREKFFNEDLKLKFLNGSDVPSGIRLGSRGIFFQTAEEERLLGKDLSEWTNEKIKSFMPQVLSYSSFTFSNQINALNHYLRFCDPNREPIKKEEIDICQTIRNNLFSGPEALNKRFNLIFDSESKNSPDNIYRCFLWLIFMGFQAEDIFDIEESDIDIKNKTINYDGIMHKIPDVAIMAFKKCISLDYFTMYTRYPYNRERIQGTKFFRMYSEIKDVKKYFYFTLHKISDRFLEKGFSVDTNIIRRSGAYYRLYEREKQGIEPNYLRTYLEYNNGSNNKAILISKCRTDYKNWRMAFYPDFVGKEEIYVSPKLFEKVVQPLAEKRNDTSSGHRNTYMEIFSLMDDVDWAEKERQYRKKYNAESFKYIRKRVIVSRDIDLWNEFQDIVKRLLEDN